MPTLTIQNAYFSIQYLLKLVQMPTNTSSKYLLKIIIGVFVKFVCVVGVS